MTSAWAKPSSSPKRLFAYLVAALSLTGCGLFGGGQEIPHRMDGKVLHGRYLDPDGRFSFRLPMGASKDHLQAVVETPWMGELLIPGYWGSFTQLQWEPLPIAMDLEGEEGLRRHHDLQRSRAMETAQGHDPNVSLVHHERIGEGKGAQDLFVVKVPGGSPFYRPVWGLGRSHLDLYFMALRFQKQDLSFLVSIGFTPGGWGDDEEALAGGAGVEETSGYSRRKESILDLAGRVSLDDPLLDHVRASLASPDSE